MRQKWLSSVDLFLFSMLVHFILVTKLGNKFHKLKQLRRNGKYMWEKLPTRCKNAKWMHCNLAIEHWMIFTCCSIDVVNYSIELYKYYHSAIIIEQSGMFDTKPLSSG